MGCNCRNSLNVQRLVNVSAENPNGNGSNVSTANVNERTDKRTKLKILQEMWEAAKKRKAKSIAGQPEGFSNNVKNE